MLGVCVCVFNCSIKSTDTMVPRFARGWLEEGEDLQLILCLLRYLFLF